VRFFLRVVAPLRVRPIFTLAALAFVEVLAQARPALAQSLQDAPGDVAEAAPENAQEASGNAGDPSIPPASSPHDLEAEVNEEEIERAAEAQAIVEGLHLGPYVAFAFPSLQAGLDARVGGLGFSVNYGYTPRKIRGTKLTLTSFGVTLRTFPFLGAFYTGFAFGQQNLRAEKRGSGTGKAVVEKRENLYMTPHVGLQFHLTSSLYFAQELGLVLFANGKRDGSLARSVAATDATTQGQVVGVAETYGENWMPYVTFWKLGFQF